MNICNIILDYIQAEDVSGALLLNGPWGIGKTHYWKTEVVKVIESTTAPSGKRKFTCLYVSLNGMTDPEEIMQQLLVEKFPWTKHKAVKWTRATSGLLLNTFEKIPYLNSIIGESTGEAIKKSKWAEFLNFENSVICFDDLERNNIQPELLGYINTNFVEHAQIKTIIIGNEKEIIRSEAYYRVKEKLIHRTIECPIALVSLQQLIDRYQSNKHFYNWLVVQLPLLEHYKSQFAVTNLRTLLGIVRIIRRIHQLSFYENASPAFIQFSFIFIFSISLEIEAGHLKSADYLTYFKLDDLSKDIYQNTLLAHLMAEQTRTTAHANAEPDPYHFAFYRRYHLDQKGGFYFFETLYQYILSADPGLLKPEKEHNGFAAYQKKVNEDQTPEKVAFKAIRFAYFIDSDSELQTELSNFLQFVQEGRYVFYEYEMYYDMLCWLVTNEIIDDDVNRLRGIVMEGLQRSMSSHTTRVDHFYEEFLKRSPTRDAVIRQLIDDKLAALFAEQERKEINSYFEALQSDANEVWLKYEYYNFFEKLSPNVLFEHLTKVNGLGRKRFYESLDKLSKITNLGDSYRVYRLTIATLLQLVQDKKNSLPPSLERYHYKLIAEGFQAILTKIDL